MNNRTLMIIGAIFLIAMALGMLAGDGKTRFEKAAEACQKNGKQLKSYKDTSSGVEFTCE